ncbi:MAG TPA: TetR/AcrR family transcriptional regulator [Spirochaetota bacterium]|nr:TetR/AcrR family transcriptional regulator [Spirochaetota bacterium]HPJ38428.1 TetR/AcrR family transcriptional regulator [Spirochaetota bacterium]HPQ52863.1 TetR/AcrR family transcriptional regulator [Spirochaetota bacterium]
MPAKGQKRKQQIIETAKDMFIENGFQSTHIGQVCEKLNIARGTVYQYFGNKREILYAVLEQVEEKIDDILDPDDLRDFYKNNPTQKAVVKYVTERIEGTINVIMGEPIVIKLIFKDIIGIDEEVISRVDKFLEYICKILTRDVEEVKKKGVYKKTVNSEVTAHMLIGALLFVVYEFMKKDKEVLNKEVIDPIVTNYLSGVMK